MPKVVGFRDIEHVTLDRVLPKFKPEPRTQIVYRDGKPVVQAPLLCRMHNEPWQTCSKCSTQKR
jgi:hypothetical protein